MAYESPNRRDLSRVKAWIESQPNNVSRKQAEKAFPDVKRKLVRAAFAMSEQSS